MARDHEQCERHLTAILLAESPHVAGEAPRDANYRRDDGVVAKVALGATRRRSDLDRPDLLYDVRAEQRRGVRQVPGERTEEPGQRAEEGVQAAGAVGLETIEERLEDVLMSVTVRDQLAAPRRVDEHRQTR